jgi:Flp pilus assembly protein TadD
MNFNLNKTSLLILGASSVLLVGCTTTNTGSNPQVDKALERASKRGATIKDPDKEAAMYGRIYKQNPSSAKAATEYARILRKQGQLDKAEAVLAIFAADSASPHFAYSEFAAIKLAKGEYSEAEIYVDDALELKPDDAYALHLSGIALDGLSRYKEAEEAFRGALDNWEGNPVPIMNNLALNLATQGYIDEAISILERARTLEPDRKEIERNLRIIRALNEGSAQYFPEQAAIPTPMKKPK